MVPAAHGEPRSSGFGYGRTEERRASSHGHCRPVWTKPAEDLSLWNAESQKGRESIPLEAVEQVERPAHLAITPTNLTFGEQSSNPTAGRTGRHARRRCLRGWKSQWSVFLLWTTWTSGSVAARAYPHCQQCWYGPRHQPIEEEQRSWTLVIYSSNPGKMTYFRACYQVGWRNSPTYPVSPLAITIEDRKVTKSTIKLTQSFGR